MIVTEHGAASETSIFGKLRRWEIAVCIVSLLAIAGLGFVVGDQLRQTRLLEIADATDNALHSVVRDVNRDFSLVIGVTRSLAMLFFSSITKEHIPDPSLPAAKQQISLIESKFATVAAEESRRSPSIYSFQSRPGNIMTQVLPNGTAPYGINLNIASPDEIANAMRARNGFIAGPRMLRQGFPGLVTSWPLWLRTIDGGSPEAVRSEYFGTVGIVVNLTRFVDGIDLARALLNASSHFRGLHVRSLHIAYHMKNTVTGNQTWFGSREIAALSTTRSASTTVSGVQSTIYISAEASTASPTEIGAGVGAAACALLLLVVAVFLYTRWRLLKENERDLSNAPTGADGKPFVIIFTDIEKSTLLWSTVPLSMQAALDTSFGIITRLVNERNVYIVKTIGDSMMMAVSDPDVAAALMADIQREHHRASWPACIDHVYNPSVTGDDLLDIDDDPHNLTKTLADSGILVFRGLRIRIGAAYGTPKAVFDNVNKSIDYFGATTNLASRVESAARGGQILVSGELGEAINCGAINCTLTPAGEFALKGFPNQVPLFELCPKELIGCTCIYEFGMPMATVTGVSGGSSVGGSRASSDDDSDAAGACASEVREREEMIFFSTLLKTCKPRDKSVILELLGTNWRCNGATADEDRIANIAQRVSRVKATLQEKEARRARQKSPFAYSSIDRTLHSFDLCGSDLCYMRRSGGSSSAESNELSRAVENKKTECNHNVHGPSDYY